MGLTSEISSYAEQLRYIKFLKSEGAEKSILRAAAVKLREIKRLDKGKQSLQKLEHRNTLTSKSLLDSYASYFRPIPIDDEGFSFSFPICNDNSLEVRNFFDDFGFIIFRDVIEAEACRKTQEEIWAYLECHAPGFQARVPETYFHLSSKTYGLAPEPAIFSPQIVQNRSSPKVLHAFRMLLQEEDVLLSHDRWCVYRPTRNIPFKQGKLDVPEWKTKENLHLDLNPWNYLSNTKSLNDLRYDNLRDFSKEINRVTQDTGPHVQGVLALNENTSEDGGTVLLVGFHHLFQQWSESLGPISEHILSNGRDMGHLVWRGNGAGSYILAPNDPLHRFKQRVTLRAGSLLIWDQRVMHGSAQNNSNKFRIAQFIKAFKRAPLTEKSLQNRRMRVKREMSRNGCDVHTELLTPSVRRAIGLV